jgi:hypothetical protein
MKTQLDPDETYLIYNAIQTPDGTILESHHRHECVSHVDENGFKYFVDGGLAYCRIGCAQAAPAPKILSKSLPSCPLNEAVRLPIWGTFGKRGEEKLKYVAIADMDTEHIQKVLDTQDVLEQIKFLMEWELEQRELVSCE